jgi:hypothetical protein
MSPHCEESRRTHPNNRLKSLAVLVPGEGLELSFVILLNINVLDQRVRSLL